MSITRMHVSERASKIVIHNGTVHRMNSVWNAWVPEGHAPARACVEAHMARSALLVEICVIAALPD